MLTYNKKNTTFRNINNSNKGDEGENDNSNKEKMAGFKIHED